MTTSVYRITNLVNGKVYFGKASNVQIRWWQHKNFAKRSSQLPVHRALRKYGPDQFSWEILATYDSNAEASEHERVLIASVPQSLRYNVAKGGDGGQTLSQWQLEGQYAIKPERYEEFRSLFYQGLSARAIAEHFCVGRAVFRTAKRLGLSFSTRGKAKPKPRPKAVKMHQSRAKLTKEERSRKQAELAARTNRERGVSLEVQRQALMLYFDESLSAQEVADRLGVTKGIVRGVVNRAYAAMPTEQRQAFKGKHGSESRQGDRNPNSHARRR